MQPTWTADPGVKKIYRFLRVKSVLGSSSRLVAPTGRFFNALTPRSDCISPLNQTVVITNPIILAICCMMSNILCLSHHTKSAPHLTPPPFFCSLYSSLVSVKLISTKNKTPTTKQRKFTTRGIQSLWCAFDRNLINYRERQAHALLSPINNCRGEISLWGS